jgi:hypothetical protein
MRIFGRQQITTFSFEMINLVAYFSTVVDGLAGGTSEYSLDHPQHQQFG